jgi:WD40 repeat protein
MIVSAQKDDINIDKLLNVNIPNILVQSVFSNQNTLDLVTSSMKDPKEKDKFIVDIKVLSNIDNTMKTCENLNNFLYINDITNKSENDLSNEIDSILNNLENEFDKKLEDIEKSLIIPKDNNLFLFIKNKISSFNSNPSNLIYNKDICTTAHKTNSIDSVFSAFKSLKGESLIIWGTPQCSIECYDLGLDKIVKTVQGAHSQTIFSCRHYLDRKGKRDLVITSSYDRCIKVWDIKNNWANIVNIPTAHTGYYIYSVCVLCDEKDENYIISSAPNEYCKIWNFKGVYLRNFGVNNESTYFVDAFYDYKECKYYILNANSTDVKSYDFKTGKLYKSYKGSPQTWHMSALVYEINEVQTLIESDGNGYIRLWDFHTGLLIKSIYSGNVINLRGICIWNEQFLFSTGSDYQVKLFDLKNGKYVKGFAGHTSTVCVVDKIECSKYGECLISHGLDGKLKLWTISQN